jgi:hypothetical protein
VFSDHAVFPVATIKSKITISLKTIKVLFLKASLFNRWLRNYWSKSRIFPKSIFGKIKINSIFLPWINFDWRPVKNLLIYRKNNNIKQYSLIIAIF